MASAVLKSAVKQQQERNVTSSAAHEDVHCEAMARTLRAIVQLMSTPDARIVYSVCSATTGVWLLAVAVFGHPELYVRDIRLQVAGLWAELIGEVPDELLDPGQGNSTLTSR